MESRFYKLLHQISPILNYLYTECNIQDTIRAENRSTLKRHCAYNQYFCNTARP